MVVRDSRERIQRLELLKISTDAEKDARKRFTSGPAGNLALGLRDSQNILLGLMAIPIEQPVAQSYQQQAILALSCNVYKLSRCADLTVSSGYAIASFPIVRAVYERVATAIYARSNARFAEELVERELKQGDVDKFATRAQDLVALFDEYAAIRGGAGTTGLDFASAKRDISRLYGPLSDFSHPKQDAHALYFGIEPTTGKAAFQYKPDEDASPFAILLLLFLWLMQLFLEALLLVEFHNEGERNWEMLSRLWENSLATFAEQVPPSLERVNRFVNLGVL